MNEKTENKKMTNAKVNAIYVGLFLSIMGQFVYPVLEQYFPELTESKRQTELIHEESMKAVLEFPFAINKKYKTDSINYYNELKSIKRRYNSEVQLLKQEVSNLKDINEATQKQTQFNTIGLSITNEALYEEMEERDHNCPVKYRETNGGDNWFLMDDYYDSRILYSVDIRTNCRAYYTPIFRSKIKVQ